MSATFLCIASFFRGTKFINACKDAGNTVYLITSWKWSNKPWPKEKIDDIFYLDADENDNWKTEDLLSGIAYLLQTHHIDRVIPLDEFDLEKAALIRETFRIPGMGQTTARYFRDKLAMRMKAEESKLPVPPYSSLFNNERLAQFLSEHSGPWIIKPRSSGATIGMFKCENAADVWEKVLNLGNNRKDYLIEKFIEGDVFHADSLTYNGKILFTLVSKYLSPPFEVVHGGGIFRSVNIPYDSKDDVSIKKLNEKILHVFGMQHSASHTEFILSKSGELYFLETASRVAGANLSEMIEGASGLELWHEWARLETAVATGNKYKLPTVKKGYGGIITSLANVKNPDYQIFNDLAIKWTLNFDYHVGFVITGDSYDSIIQKLDDCFKLILHNYHSSAPAIEKRVE